MLMTYRCASCGRQERIWNSRDGVTPLSCTCPHCQTPMQHIEWDADQYRPDYTLNDGERFWRDGTAEEAVAIMQARFEALRDQYPLTPDQEASMLEQVRSGISYEFPPGWPKLAVFTQPLPRAEVPA